MYTKKDYSKLRGAPGFSDKALETHFALYEGYVTNVGKIGDSLKELADKDKRDTPEYSELKRRAGWEWNGMRLHELYFENIAKEGLVLEPKSELAKKLTEDFGAYADWEKDFRATGMMRGIGWVILYAEPQAGSLFNAWINEHDCGHPAGAKPILVMDVFEHAYFPDYGKDRASYIDAFMKNIDWQTVEKRLG